MHRIAVTLLVGGPLLLASMLDGRQASTRPTREVAVTFDDVPGVAMQTRHRCDAAAYAAMNRKLIESITRSRMPATGFVVEGRLCRRQADIVPILDMWLDAGLALGNHSFSHEDINSVPLDRFQADVIRGEHATMARLARRGKKLEYFRHPFLHAGKDQGTKSALEAFLRNRGYTVAPVTIDNQEWLFAEVYAMALEHGDSATARTVAADYLKYMEEIFAFFERRSREVVGRDIRQILLLHANPLNADYLDALVQMMRRRGYAFVSLAHALKDPAYRLPDTYAGPDGLSWIHRWGYSKGMKVEMEPREPAHIAALFTNLSSRRR